MKLLCGMYTPVSGRILADGVELSSLAVARLAGAGDRGVPGFRALRARAAGARLGVGLLERAGEEDFVRGGAGSRRWDGGSSSGCPTASRTRVGTRFTGGRSLSGGGVAARGRSLVG